MKTLGICIPTYRRPALLRRCIDSAIASAGSRPIEIFVADDSMSDANVTVMGELIATHSFVHWRRNEQNLGIDANIQRAVELCACDYAWLIGEDDVFLPGAVARMHERIQTLHAPFVFANYRYVGESPDNVLGVALDPVTAAAVPRDTFITQHLWALGFIGACVLRRRDWLGTDANPYVGTYFTHVGRITEILASTEAVTVVSDPCVANRVEGQDTFTWKKDSYGVFFGFVDMCRRVGRRVPALALAMEQSSEGFERRFRWLSLRLAIRLRSDGAYDYAQYRRYLAPVITSSVKRLTFMLISVVPPATFRPLVVVYRRVRGATGQ